MYIYIHTMIEKQNRCFIKGEGSRRYMFHIFLKSKCINWSHDVFCNDFLKTKQVRRKSQIELLVGGFNPFEK